MAYNLPIKDRDIEDHDNYDEPVQTIEIDPLDTLNWNAKGNALTALNRDIEAEAAYNKAKELGYGK